MCLSTSDDRGATEPFTDLPAIGLVSAGILLFGYLMTSAYFSYTSAAYYAAENDDLRAIALSVASDPSLVVDGCSFLADAGKLEDSGAMAALAGRYGHPGCPLAIRVETPGHTWTCGEPGKGRSASYRLPICVRLNDATTVPGSLVITTWEGQ